jgi:hypothetical protein
VRVLRPDQHAETGYAQQRHEHIDQPSLLRPVRNGANDDRKDSSAGVRRHGKQVCGRTAVAECIDDGGQEEGKGVQCAIGSHVDDCETPGFPVRNALPEVGHFEFL